jgi:hypothetical protein
MKGPELAKVVNNQNSKKLKIVFSILCVFVCFVCTHEHEQVYLYTLRTVLL